MASKYINYDSENEIWSDGEDSNGSNEDTNLYNETPITRIEWEGYQTDRLLILYEHLKNYSKSTGIPIFDKLEFHDFVNFAWDNSYKYPIGKKDLFS